MSLAEQQQDIILIIRRHLLLMQQQQQQQGGGLQESHAYTDLYALKSFVPLHDLKKGLRGALSHVQAELIELINREYESFISLASHAQSTGDVLSDLQPFLHALELQALESGSALSTKHSELQSLLHRKHSLRLKKDVLNLKLQVQASLSRLSSLLLNTPSLQTLKLYVYFFVIGGLFVLRLKFT
jgi:hypothetical protein